MRNSKEVILFSEKRTCKLAVWFADYLINLKNLFILKYKYYWRYKY